MTATKKDTPSLSSLVKSDDKTKADETKIDNKTKNDETTVKPEDVKSEDKTDHNEDNKQEPYLSKNVVSTVPNKTPAELAAETPDETAARYNVDTTITDEDADNPRVQAYRDTVVRQVPSGTHLHPDVAKDLQNRGISEVATDNAQVKRTITEVYDFAPDAEHNDKF